MDATLTLYLIGLALVFAAFCGWRGMRPYQPHLGVRLIPWRPLMVAGFATAMLLLWLLVHTHKS